MKNKKSIYFLLPLVLLIWGAVMYEFFSFSKEEESIDTTQTEITVKPLNFKKREIVTIDVNYRDPFLGKMYAQNDKVNSNKGVKKKVMTSIKKSPKPIETIVWPTILFKGIVSDTKEKVKVFMLIIDGRTYLMRAKNKENGVLLVEGDRESVEVEYKGESKLILIEE